MKKRVLFAVIIVASTAAAAYTLHMLDMMVYGTLYNYGLRFDYGWANPYWNLLILMWVLLSIIAATTIASTLFYIRAARRQGAEGKPESKFPLPSKTFEKTPIMTRTTVRTEVASTPPSLPSLSTTAFPPSQTAKPPVSKPVSPQAPTTPSPSPQPATDLPRVFKCGHCGRSFTQPLRMLDFNSDRPTIISICPFCNETAIKVVPTEKTDQKRNGKAQSS